MLGTGLSNYLSFTCLLFCSVDSNLHVKIADCALSRDLFPHDYYCLGDNDNRPIKWLSYESLVHRKFSTASDVVSIMNLSRLGFFTLI